MRMIGKALAFLCIALCVIIQFDFTQWYILIWIAGISTIVLVLTFFVRVIESQRMLWFFVVICSLVALSVRILKVDYPINAIALFGLAFSYVAVAERGLIRKCLLRVSWRSWIGLSLVYTVLSIAGLGLWVHYSSVLSLEYLENKNILTLLIMGILFPVFNAIYEEFLFRGYLLAALISAGTSRLTAVIVQASSFAAIHYAGGFPGGIAGFIMTFIYGALMGHLYIKYKSLVPCLISHLLCDMAVFVMLVWRAYGY